MPEGDIQTVIEGLAKSCGFSEREARQKVKSAMKPTPNERKTQAQADTGEGTFETFIDELNSNHAVVMVGGKCCVLNEIIDPVFKRPDITLSSVNDFKNFYANKTIPGVDKHGKPKPIRIADLWLSSEQRREYQGIVFNPAGDAPGYYNLWRGLAVEPRPGDWSLMREHIWDVVCCGNPEIFDYVMAWLADLFQNPGGKRPGVAIVLQGKQGTGKGIFANTVGRILGSHYLHLSSATHLTGRFNHHLKDALLVFLDEALWGGDKASEGRLKALITEDNELVEPKGKDAFSVKNFKRVIVSSNNSWIIPAGLEERRFLCLTVPDTYLQNHAYFTAIIDQMEAGGYEAMLHELLAHKLKVNLREAPKTEALFDQIVAGMTPIQKFWYERLQSGWPLEKEFEPLYHEQSPGDRQTGWGSPIPVDRFYTNYLQFSERVLNLRHNLALGQFGRELKKLCPGLKRTQPDIHGERAYFYEFPPLRDCRKAFEELLRGYSISWENEPKFFTAED